MDCKGCIGKPKDIEPKCWECEMFQDTLKTHSITTTTESTEVTYTLTPKDDGSIHIYLEQ